MHHNSSNHLFLATRRHSSTSLTCDHRRRDVTRPPSKCHIRPHPDTILRTARISDYPKRRDFEDSVEKTRYSARFEESLSQRFARAAGSHFTQRPTPIERPEVGCATESLVHTAQTYVTTRPAPFFYDKSRSKLILSYRAYNVTKKPKSGFPLLKILNDTAFAEKLWRHYKKWTCQKIHPATMH